MRIISLHATNIELTPAIKDYVELKTSTLNKLTSHFDSVAELSVEVGKTTKHHAKGPYYRSEMHLKIPGDVLHAEETAEDLYAAIDASKDQLKRQLQEHKDKAVAKVKRTVRPGKE